MIDLSNNNTPLKDLPEEAQMQVLRAYLSASLVVTVEGSKYKPGSLGANGIYRIPAQPPVYPWEHIADWVEWLAVDEDGSIWAYECEPAKDSAEWVAQGGSVRTMPIKIERGTVPWTETLQQRPKAEGEE